MAFGIDFDFDFFPQENRCIICPDGITATQGDDYAPHANNGYYRTCAELVQDAFEVESGTDDCGVKEINDMFNCCYIEPLNPCTICPNGITNDLGDDHFPAAWDFVCINTLGTCKALVDEARRFESGSDACLIYEGVVPECCPTTTSMVSTTTTTIFGD